MIERLREGVPAGAQLVIYFVSRRGTYVYAGAYGKTWAKLGTATPHLYHDVVTARKRASSVGGMVGVWKGVAQ